MSILGTVLVFIEGLVRLDSHSNENHNNCLLGYDTIQPGRYAYVIH